MCVCVLLFLDCFLFQKKNRMFINISNGSLNNTATAYIHIYVAIAVRSALCRCWCCFYCCCILIYKKVVECCMPKKKEIRNWKYEQYEYTIKIRLIFTNFLNFKRSQCDSNMMKIININNTYLYADYRVHINILCIDDQKKVQIVATKTNPLHNMVDVICYSSLHSDRRCPANI